MDRRVIAIILPQEPTPHNHEKKHQKYKLMPDVLAMKMLPPTVHLRWCRRRNSEEERHIHRVRKGK